MVEPAAPVVEPAAAVVEPAETQVDRPRDRLGAGPVRSARGELASSAVSGAVHVARAARTALPLGATGATRATGATGALLGAGDGEVLVHLDDQEQRAPARYFFVRIEIVMGLPLW